MALILLVFLFPLISILWGLVRLTSTGPGIFQQLRTGKDGQPFTMFKLRTMRVDAERNGPQWATPDDPRTTRIGQWLRATHLDELPQLFNVLKGEMSLVGPRPERPEFVRVLTKKIPTYRRRLSVLPGVSGLAQVNLPPDDGIESVRKKLYLDLKYIDTVGWSLDIRLICCTAAKVIGLNGDRAARFLNLKQPVPRNPLLVATLERKPDVNDEPSGLASKSAFPENKEEITDHPKRLSVFANSADHTS